MNKVPKLRFPEFSGEWEEKELGEMSMKIIDGDRGINYPSSSDFFSEGHCLFLNAKNVTKTGFYFGENNFITQEKDELLKKGKLERGDLVLTTRGTVGNVAYFDKKINYENLRINSGMVILRNNGLEISSKYIYHYLISPKMEKEIINTSFGSAQPQLTVKNISSFKFDTPTLLEQEKIASFLSEVDKNIELLEEERELFQQYKKGMMQKIFSQELRFKDENGEEYPEWEEKSFGEIYSFKNTNSYSRDNLNYEDGEVKNIHYGDIHTKFRTLFNINEEDVPFVNRDISLEKISIENYCQNGDLVIADASEDYADIGKSIEIINVDNQKILAGLHTFLARPIPNKIILGFGGYLMKSPKFHSQIKVIAQGTKVLSLSSKRVADLKIPTPSLPEQKKIADFLFSLDEKIQITSDELDGMKEFKKGLLQQMFV